MRISQTSAIPDTSETLHHFASLTLLLHASTSSSTQAGLSSASNNQFAAPLTLQYTGQEDTELCIQAQGVGRPGRGRPKGLPAWNKGKPMSAVAKQHLSQSQKARWKKSPALRTAVSSKLKVSLQQSHFTDVSHGKYNRSQTLEAGAAGLSFADTTQTSC